MRKAMVLEINVFIHMLGYVVGVVGVQEVFELWVGVGGFFKVSLNGVAEFVSEATRLFVSKCGGVGSGAVNSDLDSGMYFVSVSPFDGKVGNVWHELWAGDGVVTSRWWLGGVGCVASR